MQRGWPCLGCSWFQLASYSCGKIETEAPSSGEPLSMLIVFALASVACNIPHFFACHITFKTLLVAVQCMSLLVMWTHTCQRGRLRFVMCTVFLIWQYQQVRDGNISYGMISTSRFIDSQQFMPKANSLESYFLWFYQTISCVQMLPTAPLRAMTEQSQILSCLVERIVVLIRLSICKLFSMSLNFAFDCSMSSELQTRFRSCITCLFVT